MSGIIETMLSAGVKSTDTIQSLQAKLNSRGILSLTVSHNPGIGYVVNLKLPGQPYVGDFGENLHEALTAALRKVDGR